MGEIDNIEITLKLTALEANTVLHFLGEDPTKSGVYPLAMKIKEQADAQVPAAPAAAE